jgi:hypothetical protein
MSICPGNTHRLRWGALGSPDSDETAYHLGTVLGQRLGADLPDGAEGEFQTRESRRIASALLRLSLILQGVFAEGTDHSPARRYELAFLDGLLVGILTELQILLHYHRRRRPLLPLVDELVDSDDY